MVVVGRIRSPHGLKGMVKATTGSGSPGTISSLRKVSIGFGEGDLKDYEIEAVRRVSDDVILLKLHGIDTPEMASELKGMLVMTRKEELPMLPEGSYYFFELEGCDVLSENGEMLGKVIRVDRYPANDVLAIEGPGIKEFLVPIVRDIIKSIDLASYRIVVEDRKGLRTK